MDIGRMEIPKLDGKEIAHNIFAIGEPTPILGTNFLRCLANVRGALCVVELSIKFCNGDEA